MEVDIVSDIVCKKTKALKNAFLVAGSGKTVWANGKSQVSYWVSEDKYYLLFLIYLFVLMEKCCCQQPAPQIFKNHKNVVYNFIALSLCH